MNMELGGGWAGCCEVAAGRCHNDAAVCSAGVRQLGVVACPAAHRHSHCPAPHPSLPAVGVSTWTKSSSGGPPAPGQTSEAEEGVGGLAGLEALGTDEDAQLTGARFTLR